MTSVESSAPERPSRRFLALGVAALVVVAALRLATLAPDPWEWDEILFKDGVANGIDTRVNHPHAPGYPAFVLLGRGIAALGIEPFRATVLAGAIGGLASVTGLVFLLRVAGLSPAWSLFGGIAYALVPAVWLHGVRPLSDGPGTAAFLFAAAFLVRCGRMGAGRDLVLGALFTALAAGVRPQVGLALLPLAAWGAWNVARKKEVRPLVVAVAVGLGVSALVWIPAIAGSGGWASWLERFRGQMEYVRSFDSPSSRDLVTFGFWTRWLADPFGDRKLALAVWLLAAAAFLGRPRRAFLLLAVFAPVTALSVTVLAVHTSPRYALALLPLPCALLAIILEAAAERSDALRRVAAAAGVVALGWMAFRAVTIVVEVATHASPPVALMKTLRDDPALAGRPILYDPSLEVHVGEYLGGRKTSAIPDDVPANPLPGGVIAAADGDYVGLTPAGTFAFTSPRLSLVSRARYLQTKWYDGRDGAAVHVPRVSGDGSWDVDRNVAVLRAGAVLEMHSGTGVLTVAAVARVRETPAAIRIEGSEGAVVLSFPQGEHPLSFEGRAVRASQVSFRIRGVAGEAEIGDFRIRVVTEDRISDDSLLGSIDSPEPGAEVRGDLLVSGWCQDWGAKRVDPVDVRVDGTLIPGLAVARVPRPDVAKVFPKMGDTSRAGYEIVIPAGVLPPGHHLLTVTFAAEGGRRRVFPAREFAVVR